MSPIRDNATGGQLASFERRLSVDAVQGDMAAPHLIASGRMLAG